MIRPGEPLRARLEALCSTRIMTVDEFVAFCEGLRQARQLG
jgi:hypothetical protein